jgi:hypothetical protein
MLLSLLITALIAIPLIIFPFVFRNFRLRHISYRTVTHAETCQGCGEPLEANWEFCGMCGDARATSVVLVVPTIALQQRT